MSKTKFVGTYFVRPAVEPRLPDWIEPHWFETMEEGIEAVPGAEIGWLDMIAPNEMRQVISAATDLKWLSSIFAGVDAMPLQQLKSQGTIVTNGVGINAITIAEYVVMAMLNIAKGYKSVVEAQQRNEWLHDSPGKVELFGSKALLLGYGAIGKLVEERLTPFGVEVTKVRRSPAPGALTPDAWRSRLSEFDWVILAVPSTAETEGMIGAAELAAMKDSASLINIARGNVIDQDALIAALHAEQIGSAWLDVTTPEPLPPEHPLWDTPNAHVSMHLSGRAQTRMLERSTDRFFENLERYRNGEALEPLVNLDLGY